MADPIYIRRMDIPALYHISVSTFDRAVARGELRTYRRGNCRHVRRDEMERWIEGRKG